MSPETTTLYNFNSLFWYLPSAAVWLGKITRRVSDKELVKVDRAGEGAALLQDSRGIYT